MRAHPILLALIFAGCPNKDKAVDSGATAASTTAETTTAPTAPPPTLAGSTPPLALPPGPIVTKKLADGGIVGVSPDGSFFQLPPNFVMPSALPSGFPTAFPSTMPSGFPTALPSGFPTFPPPPPPPSK